MSIFHYWWRHDFLWKKIFLYFKRGDLRRSRSDHLGRWRQGDRPVRALYLQKSGRAASQRFLIKFQKCNLKHFLEPTAWGLNYQMMPKFSNFETSLSLRDYLEQEGKLSHRPTRLRKVNRLRHLREPLIPRGANTKFRIKNLKISKLPNGKWKLNVHLETTRQRET